MPPHQSLILHTGFYEPVRSMARARKVQSANTLEVLGRALGAWLAETGERWAVCFSHGE